MTQEVKRFDQIRGLAPQTMMLVDYLKQAKKDGKTELTYEDLSRRCGRNVQAEGYANLRTARHRIIREDGDDWEPVSGVGLKLANAEDVVSLTDSAIKATRRKAKRAIDRLTLCAPDSELTPELQARKTGRQTVLLLMLESTKPKTMAAIEAKNGSIVPDGRKLLEALQK